jgi:tRNA uridine 5-carbamoylmethylation protein Kti12
MAGIKTTVSFTDGSTLEVNASISDADVPRLLAAMAVKYRKPDDQDAAWLIKKWTEDVIVDALNYTQRYEQQLAAEAASAAVQMIPVTIS